MSSDFFRNDTVYRYDAVSDEIDPPLSAGFLTKVGPEDMEEEYHPRLAVIYVLHGAGRYVDHRGREYPLGPGTVFVRHPKLPHSTYVEPASQYAEAFVSLHARAVYFLESLGLVDEDRLVSHRRPDFRWPKEIDRIRDRLRMAEGSELTHLQMDILQVMVGMLTSARQKEARGAEDIVRAACHRLDSAIYDRRSVPVLLGGLGMSYSRLRSLFRERVGMSPGEYRINKRIEMASALLADGRQNIQQIADTLGYPDAYTFSTQFKKMTGYAPTTYSRSYTAKHRGAL